MNPRKLRLAKYEQIHVAAEMEGDGQLKAAMRELCLVDLFYLLVVACKREDVNRDWLFCRCEEVQNNPDGYLDLWAREHYKSTLITFGKTLQDILSNPEITVGIFSHTKPIAKAFLRQIKQELQDNARLKYLFDDVLYQNPRRESPLWSEDKGIVVKRVSNPKEATVEASGLVDGQPTSKHYSLLVYDDVVTLESVTTPEMIEKVTTSWAISLNLAAAGGAIRYIGTRYHANDTWSAVIRREAAKERIHPATDNGKVDGEPVFLSRRVLEKKRQTMGSFVYAAQMLQNPSADEVHGFNEDDLNYYTVDPARNLNVYITVDPANEKKKRSDWTAMWVIGLGADHNYYVLDMVRDRLNLTERTEKLIELHQKWRPINVGYEKYGMQSDIQHIQYVQELKNYRFGIVELGGTMSKVDRIRRLIPSVEGGRWYFPAGLLYRNYEGRVVDLVQLYKDDEFVPFPVCAHDDMLDGQARILDDDMRTTWPAVYMQSDINIPINAYA